MFIAKSEDLQSVLLGTEFQSKTGEPNHPAIDQGLSCPICGKPVEYHGASNKHPFEYFAHLDESPDCFQDESVSSAHRLTVEVAVKTLHNRIREVTGEPVEIDVEKWIGTRPQFVVADVRITSPIRMAAEIFYKAEWLSLRRRFETMFNNGYRVYLIFHADGRHAVDEVERNIQQLAPLRVGRFDPNTLELTLGDLFSETHIDISDLNRDLLPNYIVC